MLKHIEFTLPRANLMQGQHYIRRLESGIRQWLENNSVSDYDLRVSDNNSVLAFTLSDEQLYTLFLLAWNEPTLPIPRMVTAW
jgi:hypothetical protein